MKQKRLTTAGKGRLRKTADKLFGNCENADDAEAAGESVRCLEKLILAGEEDPDIGVSKWGGESSTGEASNVLKWGQSPCLALKRFPGIDDARGVVTGCTG